MSVTTALAIYFLIWWITLFAILPWGIRSQGEGGEVTPGTDPGAPTLARIGMRLLWTTLVSGVLFGLIYLVYTFELVTLDGFPGIPNMPRTTIR
ncbi:MAG: DUF1467 family protein [Pseudorhodoplanes sp.]|nr:hypothetical protein [Pseudorhodoplanes sp.]MBW7950419.1 DUF1467 family protein [Pseudorhodoplanes sp.]MCL4712891.1 DUF1467 family protein [Pseudorhodoplanes sp.]MCQ3942305.1 DUF1467 domain-containing protein [Alphaproteobacteria bacterium]MCZ7643088.1 DUF1467 family protein [Pseudorhodoplanes sp.]